MNYKSSRNRIIGIRETHEFVRNFEALCENLGHNRSKVIRYCLKKFFIEHYNNLEMVRRARKEMFLC